MRPSGTGEQPGVVAPPATDEQLKTSPGTLPATAVIWNEDSGSKAMPHPVRMTVLLPDPGLQAIPTRGPMAPRLLLVNQRSACAKLTSPCVPIMGELGTYTRPPDSLGAGLASQRNP